MDDLIKIQSEINVPKRNKNDFGGYYYRSTEDILEALKPIAHKYGYAILLSDEIVEVGGRVYIKATAMLSGEKTYKSEAFAREAQEKKKMDEAQVTGAASSYARKYALSGLLALDDIKDPDAQKPEEKAPKTEEKTKAYLTNDMPAYSRALDYVRNGGNIEEVKKKYRFDEQQFNLSL